MKIFKRKNINFDYNAFEMPNKHVFKALKQLYKKGYSNPSAIYKDGIETSELVEKCRSEIARILNCDADEIFFTSGASESNSWVAMNYKLEVDKRSHNSLLKASEQYRHNALSLEGNDIISFPLVVSETGKNLLIEDYKIYKTYKYFIDITQAIGKIEIDLHNNPSIIFASASAQKIGGLSGCGILYIRKKYQKSIRPLICGSQEKGLRGGTLNVPAIVCFTEALKEAYNKDYVINSKMVEIKNLIANTLISKNYIDNFKTYNNVINITFKKLLASTAVQLFNNYGINVSAGSACNSGDEKPSQAYLGSGYTEDEAMRTIRVSIGHSNTIRETKKFCKILKEIIDNYDF